VATADAARHSEALGILTLISWLCTVSLGAYMLATVVGRDGLRRQRTVRDGLPPGVLISHFSLALTALLIWVGYLATGWAALAWSAVGLLTPAFGLGICTVTLWTPYPGPGSEPADGKAAGSPGHRPARRLSDETLARALTDDVLASELVEDLLASMPSSTSPEAKRRRGPWTVVIPFGHGMAAVATFVLAVVTAAGAG
jgi:hypothetical protein